MTTKTGWLPMEFIKRAKDDSAPVKRMIFLVLALSLKVPKSPRQVAPNADQASSRPSIISLPFFKIDKLLGFVSQDKLS